MPDAFGHRSGDDASVIVDDTEYRLSTAALDREHPAKQIRQMGGALDRFGDIRNYRLEGRIVDEGAAERVRGLVVLLGVERGDVGFSILRHCFRFLDSIRRARERAPNRIMPSGEQSFTLGVLHFRFEDVGSLDKR